MKNLSGYAACIYPVTIFVYMNLLVPSLQFLQKNCPRNLSKKGQDSGKKKLNSTFNPLRKKKSNVSHESSHSTGKPGISDRG